MNLEYLLKLRLVIARFGEMDLAKWWNTKGQLGSLGATALRRGFPRSHYFAQARSVFAVAGHRCKEIYDPPGSVTLWSLPETIEEEFDAQWEHWIEQSGVWQPFFQKLDSIHKTDLVATLQGFELVDKQTVESFSRLKRTADGHAVLLPGQFSGAESDIALLGIGFARGEIGSVVVPYARLS